MISAAAALSLAVASAHAAPAFVGGLVIDGATIDASGGALVNDGRMGFFSDIYYDAIRGEWWALSDRGPGGGTLPYETRVHRFKLDFDCRTGAISNFRILKTLIFRAGANALDGFAPPEAGPLGLAFDPEGLVVNPRTGHLLVSDEYGPSLVEINRAGQLVRRYTLPANILPRAAGTGIVNHANDTGNTAGKRTNRGFEGLAISPDGRTVYAMLQSAMLDEGGGSGVMNRIVAFDTRTARPLAQYAYRMEGSSQGRGISALVAINDHEFLVLERNNRGLGVDANLASPNKKVFRIDLSGATDVTGWTRPARALYAGDQDRDAVARSRSRDHAGRCLTRCAGWRVAGEVGGPGDRPALQRRQLPRAGRHRQRLLGHAERQQRAVRRVLQAAGGGWRVASSATSARSTTAQGSTLTAVRATRSRLASISAATLDPGGAACLQGLHRRPRGTRASAQQGLTGVRRCHEGVRSVRKPNDPWCSLKRD